MINKHHLENGTPLKLFYNKITEFDFSSEFGMPRPIFFKMIDRCLKQWDTLEPTEPMLSHKIKTLSDMCNRLDIVTANKPHNLEYIELFLKKHDIQYNDIVFETDKQVLDYDLFIDDSPMLAQDIFNAGKSIMLYDQPWNANTLAQKNTDQNQLIRAHSMDHIIHLLQN